MPVLESLRLEQAGEQAYVAPSVPSDTRPVVFGGQLLGQMIMAAAAAQPGKDVRSLHAIFAQAGTVSRPVELETDVMHSGRALASVTVTARQGDRLLSRGLLLLDAGEPDLIRHSPPMPDVPGPDSAAPQPWAESGSQVRIVGGVDVMASEATGPPELFVWVRFPAAGGEQAAGGQQAVAGQQAVHRALLAWYTDPFLIATALRPHEGIGQGMAHESISTGVVTHTLSFHEPADPAGWLLLAHESSYAGHGRTYGSGSVFTEDGRLVASFVQDNLVRSLRPQARTSGAASMTL